MVNVRVTQNVRRSVVRVAVAPALGDGFRNGSALKLGNHSTATNNPVESFRADDGGSIPAKFQNTYHAQLHLDKTSGSGRRAFMCPRAQG